jgi:hypothetical protein
MNLIGREATRALKGLERALGKPMFVWNNQPFPYTPGTTQEMKALVAGGYTPEGTTMFNVRASVLPAPGPAIANTIYVRGKAYRLQKIDPSPDGEWLKFILSDANKAA